MKLYAQRLERGRFVWPQAESGAVFLTGAQLAMLLEVIDWRRPARTWQPEMAAQIRSADLGLHSVRMRAELDQLREANEALKRMLSERDAELAVARGELLVTTTLIEKLKLEIARLRRMQFGRSSEKNAERIEQLELIVEDLEASQAQMGVAPLRESTAKTPPVRRSGRPLRHRPRPQLRIVRQHPVVPGQVQPRPRHRC